MKTHVAAPKDGKVCFAMDLDYGGARPEYMDILTPEGMVQAMYAILKLRPGATCTLAPVCSTWVWLRPSCITHKGFAQLSCTQRYRPKVVF